MGLDPAAVRRGTVVLIRLPRDKARPAVLIRSDLLAALSYATVLPITTERRADLGHAVEQVTLPFLGNPLGAPMTLMMLIYGEIVPSIKVGRRAASATLMRSARAS